MAKIALIQLAVTDDLQANRQRGVKAAKSAIQQGAKIICFPELAFDPFYPQVRANHEILARAESIPGPTTDLFVELAQEHQVVFVLNLFERDGDETFDSSPVIDASGEILGVTRMIHITEYEHFYEQGYYSPGDRGVHVFDTLQGRIGIAICYDRHFPEYMRRLGTENAELVVVPQAGATGEWPEGLFEAEMQVAAFQNGYFTALCNRVGREEHLTFAGESFVCSPSGQVIARARSAGDEILFCDLDFEEIDRSPARRLFYQHRRPELYRQWFVT